MVVSLQCPWPIDTNLKYRGKSDVVLHTIYQMLKGKVKEDKKKKTKKRKKDETEDDADADDADAEEDAFNGDLSTRLSEFYVPTMMSPLHKSPRRDPRTRGVPVPSLFVRPQNYTTGVAADVTVTKSVDSASGSTASEVASATITSPASVEAETAEVGAVDIQQTNSLDATLAPPRAVPSTSSVPEEPDGAAEATAEPDQGGRLPPTEIEPTEFSENDQV